MVWGRLSHCENLANHPGRLTLPSIRACSSKQLITVVESLNSTAELVDEFSQATRYRGIPRAAQHAVVRTVLQDPEELSAAGKEVGQKVAVGVGVAGVLGPSIFVTATEKNSNAAE